MRGNRRSPARRFSPVLACLCLGASVAACAPAARRTAAPEPRVLLRFAEERRADHPSAEASREFARIVGRESEGGLLVRIWDEGRLGGEEAVAEQLRFGGIDLARLQARALESYSAAAGRLGAPGCFTDEAAMVRAMEGPEGRTLAEELTEERLILLAWYDGGPECRLLPLGRPSGDFSGLRIGVDPSRSAMDLVAAAGGTPVPLALRDFRRAHEADLVDGFYTTLLAASSERLLDSLSARAEPASRSLELVVASRVTFMQLLPADRGTLLRAAAASAELQKDFRFLAERRVREALTGGTL